jgi:hypothetical protein
MPEQYGLVDASETNAPARGTRWLIGFSAIGGLLVGLALFMLNLLSLIDGWEHGRVGMFGPVFSVILTAFIFVGGGAVFGLVAGAGAVGGWLLVETWTASWLIRSLAAVVGPAIVTVVAVLALPGLDAGQTAIIVIPAIVGPFVYVALCSRMRIVAPATS